MAKLLTAFFLFNLASTGLSYFFPLFLAEQIQLKEGEIGNVLALRSILSLATVLPAGRLADSGFRVLGIMGALLGQAAGFASLGFVRSPSTFLLIFVPFAAAATCSTVVLDAIILKNAGSSRLGHFQAAKFLGLGLGTLLMGYGVAALSFKGAFLALAALMGSIICFLPRDRDNAASIDHQSIPPISGSPAHAQGAVPLLLFSFFFALHWGAESTIYPLFLRQDLKLGYASAGGYLAAEILCLAATTMLGTRRSAGILTPWTFAIACLASGIGAIGTTAPLVAVSLAFRLIHGIGDGLLFLILYQATLKVHGASRSGKGTGMFHFATIAGSVLGSFIFSRLGEHVSLAFSLQMSGIVILLSAIVGTLLHRAGVVTAMLPRPVLSRVIKSN